MLNSILVPTNNFFRRNSFSAPRGNELSVVHRRFYSGGAAVGVEGKNGSEKNGAVSIDFAEDEFASDASELGLGEFINKIPESNWFGSGRLGPSKSNGAVGDADWHEAQPSRANQENQSQADFSKKASSGANALAHINANEFLKFKEEINEIVRSCKANPGREAGDITSVKTTDYYPFWSALLISVGVVGGTVSNSSSIASGMVGMAVRPGHAVVMHDTLTSAQAAREKEIDDCLRYFVLKEGLHRLKVLEENLIEKEKGLQFSGHDRQQLADIHVSIEKIRCQLLGDANKLDATVRAAVDKCNDLGKGWLNFLRSTIVGGGLNTGGAGMQMASGALTLIKSAGVGLPGAALQFGTVASAFGVATGMATGIMHQVSAGLEIHGARMNQKALAKDKVNDKRICAAYGADVPPALQDLVRLREDMRSMKRILETLMKVQGSARAVNGAASIALASVGIAALATAGAVTAGTAAIVAGVVAGLYFLTIQTRQWMAVKERRKLEKKLEEMNARYQPNAIPGLSLSSDVCGAHEVADKLAHTLLGGGDVAKKCQEALIEMGLPESVVDVTGKNAKEVAQQLQPHLFSSSAVSHQEAIDKQYKESAAFGAVNVMAHGLDLEKKLKEKAKAAPPAGEESISGLQPWHRELAAGADAHDIRKSKLNQAAIKKYWAAPGFKAFVEKGLAQPNGSINSANDAWTRLQEARRNAPKEAFESHSQKEQIVAKGVLKFLTSRDDRPGFGAYPNAGGNASAFHEACQEKLKEFDIGRKNNQGEWSPEVVKMICNELKKLPVGLDTDDVFRAALNSRDEAVRKTAESMVATFAGTVRGYIHESDKSEFDAMLGRQGGDQWSNLANFLRATRKLQGQKLEKVITSLYEYPTKNPVHNDFLKVAALHEIRRKFPAPGPDAGKTKIQEHEKTMQLVKNLCQTKLHERTWGAGDGGGVLLLGGFVLNEKGQLVKGLLERSKKGGVLPNGALTGKLLQKLADPERGSLSAENKEQLRFLAKEVVDDHTRGVAYPNWLNDGHEQVNLATMSIKRLAQNFDLFHSPEALKSALQSKETSSEAKMVLTAKLQEAGRRVLANLHLMNHDDTRAQFDPSDFIAQMTNCLELERLAVKHGLMTQEKADNLDAFVVSPDMKPLTLEHLKFYRQALLWGPVKHPTKWKLGFGGYRAASGREKNVKAIEQELAEMKAGRDPGANFLWSNKFLRAHSGDSLWRVNNVIRESAWLVPGSNNLSYKGLVNAKKALEKMSPENVHQALQKNNPKGSIWLRLFIEKNRLNFNSDQREELRKSYLNSSDINSAKDGMRFLAEKRREHFLKNMESMLTGVFGKLNKSVQA